MDRLFLKAYAKINLGLDVLRRRGDGYHEVCMVMQTVRVYDRIILQKTGGSGIRLHSSLPFLPADRGNLAYRAAELMFDDFGLEGGLSIELKKHIPVAAGLAGGSTDAAAVLYGINKMFSLGLPREALMKRGEPLGADVPYCVMRGTALAEGIGERLTRLMPMPQCFILIAKPSISVSTRYVYENLQVDRLDAGRHPDIGGIVSALEKGDLVTLSNAMDGGNILETVTCAGYPVIDTLKSTMKKCGALVSLMSGSGPSVFGIFDDREKACAAMEAVRAGNLARQIFLTEPFNVKD